MGVPVLAFDPPASMSPWLFVHVTKFFANMEDAIGYLKHV